MLYYQNTYKGGASLDGKTYYWLSWNSPDTIHFQNSVPSGCTLKKAFLVSFKETCLSFGVYPNYDTPISFVYNNHIIQFDTSTNVTPMFLEGSAGQYAQNWMAVKDVTGFTQNSNNILITPLQAYTNTCGYYYYDSFFLLLLYENNSYNNINVVMYLNNQNQVSPTMTYTLNNLNSVNANSDVGLSIEGWDIATSPYLQYQIISSIANVDLGTLRIMSLDNANDYKTGFGSFYYENSVLSGLVDDSPDNFIDSTDALANIKGYLPGNANTFTITTSTGLNTYGSDLTSAFVMAYNTSCPPAPSNADSMKIYRLCAGQSTQLNATSGYSSYNWYPAAGLSNTGVANPQLNAQNTTNYICYVKDAAGCLHTEYAQVVVHNPPSPQSISTTSAVCGSTQGVLTILPNYHQYGYNYSINNGSFSSDTVFTNLGAGNYTLTVKDNFGCSYNKSFVIQDTNLARANFDARPSTGCAPLTVNFINYSNLSGVVTNSYVWYINSDSTNTQNLTYTFADTGKYTITLLAYETYRNCSANFTRTITVNYCPPDSINIVVPNIFSPNNDGINDSWKPIVYNYQYMVKDFQCAVYNRWGIKVFETNNINQSWNGGEENAGTYFYVLHYEAVGNSKGKKKEENLKGFIQLIK